MLAVSYIVFVTVPVSIHREVSVKSVDFTT